MHFRGNEGAGAIRTPVFMAHGANDPRLSLAETKRMIEALERHGLPVEFMMCEDQGHGFVQPKNMIEFCRRVERFLAAHMASRRLRYAQPGPPNA